MSVQNKNTNLHPCAKPAPGDGLSDSAYSFSPADIARLRTVIEQNPAARVMTTDDVGKNDPSLQGNDILAVVITDTDGDGGEDDEKKKNRCLYLTITSRGTYVLDALIGRHPIQKLTTAQELSDLIRDHGFHYNPCSVRRGFAVSRSIHLHGTPRAVSELSKQDFRTLIHEIGQFYLDITDGLIPVMTLLATIRRIPSLKP